MAAKPDLHESLVTVDAEIAGTLERNLDYVRDIARLQTLLGSGRVEEAQAWLGEMESRWPLSALIRRAARIFAPATARTVASEVEAPSKEQIRAEERWLRQNAARYPGCWVVLTGDRLLGWSPDLRQAIAEAERHGGGGSLHHIPSAVAEE